VVGAGVTTGAALAGSAGARRSACQTRSRRKISRSAKSTVLNLASFAVMPADLTRDRCVSLVRKNFHERFPDQNGVVLDRGGSEQQIDLAALAFGATGSLGLGSNLRVDPGRLGRNRVDVEQIQLALHAIEVLLPSSAARQKIGQGSRAGLLERA